jgi:hypothetical protein
MSTKFLSKTFKGRRFGGRWEIIIKMDFKEMGVENMCWIHLDEE